MPSTPNSTQDTSTTPASSTPDQHTGTHTPTQNANINRIAGYNKSAANISASFAIARWMIEEMEEFERFAQEEYENEKENIPPPDGEYTDLTGATTEYEPDSE